MISRVLIISILPHPREGPDVNPEGVGSENETTDARLGSITRREVTFRQSTDHAKILSSRVSIMSKSSLVLRIALYAFRGHADGSAQN